MPEQQPHQRGLAGRTRADYTQAFAGQQRELHTANHWRSIRHGAEDDPFDIEAALGSGQREP